MFSSVFLKTLRDQRRSLIGWAVGIVALVGMMAAMWPTVRSMPDLNEFLANYPEALRELFNIESLTTGAGFLNVELFSIILPALFVVFGVSRGARLVAGDEETGSLEVLLTTPLPRWRVVAEKAAALVVGILWLGAVLFGSTWLFGELIGLELTVGYIASATLAMTVLGLEYGALALAIGAITGRRALAMGVSGTMAVAGYVLYVAGEFVAAVEPWQVLSPFYYALGEGSVATGLAGVPLGHMWMVLAALGAFALSIRLFERRDISA